MVGAAVAGLMGAVALTGCSAGGSGGSTCTGEKCDEDATFQEQLEGKNDPIANFLRTLQVSEDGVTELDFPTLLFGIADAQGCGPGSVATFSVSDDLITEGEPFPRLVSVACKDDNAKASEFFIAASFEKFDENDQPTGEFDLHDVEAFAWDAKTREYRFYAFAPAEDAENEDQIQLEVAPDRCRGCHLTPSDQTPTGMAMTPIMNEINQPWTHWNAEPGFPSHDYNLVDRVKNSESFKDLVLAHQGPASRLEEIIRFGGHEKVVAARARKRREAPSIRAALDMLRPLFCSEQINYATEDFESGVVPSAALVDPGIRNMYKAIRPDNWVWGWVNDERTGVGIVRLPPPDGEQPVEQIPIRGNADLSFEQRLVSVKTLTPQQVLRVRALDWQTPVFSEFRCGLWRDANERLIANPPDFGDATRLSHVLSDVFEMIMTIDGNSIKVADPDSFIAMPSANSADVEALKAALASGGEPTGSCDPTAGSGVCVATVDILGAQIDDYIQGIAQGPAARDAIKAKRDPRICHVLAQIDPVDDRFDEPAFRFENRPSLPDVSCP